VVTDSQDQQEFMSLCVPLVSQKNPFRNYRKVSPRLNGLKTVITQLFQKPNFYLITPTLPISRKALTHLGKAVESCPL
jgi:hypothetical protein